jgi:hypothetical protein
VCSVYSPPAEGDRQCPRESVIALVHMLLMSPQYLGTGITSQLFIKQTYDRSMHLVPTTGHPYKMRPINGPTVSHPKLVRGSRIYHGICQRFYTDIIAQVAQTCCHPVTKTSGNCIAITDYHKPNSLHHSRGNKMIHLPSFSCISNSSFRFQLSGLC